MATESFFEDLVIDTPEAAERFAEMLRKNKTFSLDGPVFKEADEEFIREFAIAHGLKEKSDCD
ncbi:MAG: hypothetical protein E7Z63_02815 [Thermoplasmata archaeon]|nr:hypothetical protein [Thermoplasmata archaeon]